MNADDFVNILDEDDNIDFENINIQTRNQVIQKNSTVEHTKEENEIILSYASEYIDTLKQTYTAKESLFDNLEELIEESENPELLLKVLDSL